MGLAAAVQEAGLAPRCELLHVHHGSGVFADQAADLVGDYAQRLSWDYAVARLPRDSPGSARSETRWRAARMAALTELAEQRGLSWVLLAHHAADLRESVALHLMRGHRGLRALAGPACVRPLNARVMLLRPFLAESPALEPQRLAEAAACAGSPHLEDPSNASLSIPRNAVRAWLASSSGAPFEGRLAALSARARSGLGRLREHLVEALHDGLQPCGKGCRVARTALRAPPSHAPMSWLAELLRLLGAALEEAHQPHLSRGVLQRLLREVDDERDQSGSLPATPHPLPYLLRRDGLHFPHHALITAEPAARVLSALGGLPWESR
ncbi:MAG: tRNA(Ile)-lysidine synthase [Planctomycetota bacterium]|nr:MAG: tRNA(Ile)-lysidine synthase [Planctomycetota bacterium]